VTQHLKRLMSAAEIISRRSIAYSNFSSPSYFRIVRPQFRTVIMIARTLLTAAATALSLAGLAAALPAGRGLSKRTDIDNTILQFALTLEHLENIFYKEVLEKFTLQDFEQAGYTADYYNNLHYIAYDEQEHVLLLEAALKAAGQTPTQACNYSFPYTDVPSFITLSSVLEGVGTSAYLGGAPLITSKTYLTVAGAILAVEALHTSMQRQAIGKVPMANYLWTPLDPTSVYTLAAMFIVSCPATNPKLPFTPFPSLKADGTTCTCEEPDCSAPTDYVKRDNWPNSGWPKNGKPTDSQELCSPPTAGDSFTFTAASDIPSGSYVTFVNGLIVTSVLGTVNCDEITAIIPTVISSQTYVFVTKSNVEGTFSDSQILFGPAVLEVMPPAPTLNYSVLKD